jgi:DNA-binding transcriptional regulator LsrR (DeoR family)
LNIRSSRAGDRAVPRADAADTDVLVRASRLYYLEARGQAEIATMLRISRPGVSRLLKRARDTRIVEIRIRETAGDADWSSLERRLGVKELHVAPEAGVEAVGRLGARFLERTIRRGDVIGLTAGTTLSAFVQAVHPPRPLDLEIVPLVGALWDTGEDFDGSFLCQELRRRTGGTHRVLSAPAVVGDARLWHSLRREPRVRRVLERYAALRCAFVGIGVVSERHPVVVAARAASPKAGRARPAAMLPRGAVASVGSLFYDRDGRPCVGALDQRTLGISHPELAAVPLRVGLAAGAGKAEATRALARGGVLDVLVIDAPLARALLDITSQG